MHRNTLPLGIWHCNLPDECCAFQLCTHVEEPELPVLDRGLEAGRCRRFLGFIIALILNSAPFGGDRARGPVDQSGVVGGALTQALCENNISAARPNFTPEDLAMADLAKLNPGEDDKGSEDRQCQLNTFIGLSEELHLLSYVWKIVTCSDVLCPSQS